MIDTGYLKEQVFKTSKLEGCREMRNALNGLKENGGRVSIAHIVLRQEGGWHLAAFVFVYLPEANAMRRPLYYVLADVESGDLTAVFDCVKHDFTDEPFSRDYSTSDSHKGSKEEYDEAYSRLDRVRQYILETGDVRRCVNDYRRYMDCVLRYTPKKYRQFYYSLNSIDIPGWPGSESGAMPTRPDALSFQKSTAGRPADTVRPNGPFGTDPGRMKPPAEEAGRRADSSSPKRPETAPGSTAEAPGKRPDRPGETSASAPAQAGRTQTGTAGDKNKPAPKTGTAFSISQPAQAAMGQDQSVFDAMGGPEAGGALFQEPEKDRRPRNGRERNRQNNRSAETPEQIKQKHDNAVERIFGEPAADVFRGKHPETDEPPVSAQGKTAESGTSGKPEKTGAPATSQAAAASAKEADTVGAKKPAGTGAQASANPARKEETAPKASLPSENDADFEDDSSSDSTKAIPQEVMKRLVENARRKLSSWRESGRDGEQERKEAQGKTPDEANPAAKNGIDEGGPASATAAAAKWEADNRHEDAGFVGRWEPQVNLSALPDRYYHIAERIADTITFLPEREGNIRFRHPAFCFEEDSLPDADPWLVMQAKLAHTEVQTRKHEVAPGRSVFATCAYKDRCLFRVCPYVIAAYIRYLKENNPDELAAQREAYRANKRKVDAEGYTGYIMSQPKYLHYTDESIREAADLIDRGIFGVTRKKGTTDVFVVTYASKGRDRLPDTDACMNGNDIRELTSIPIGKRELEHRFTSKGYMRSVSGTRTPNGVDVLVYADYLMRAGKLPDTDAPDNGGDIITYTF